MNPSNFEPGWHPVFILDVADYESERQALLKPLCQIHRVDFLIPFSLSRIITTFSNLINSGPEVKLVHLFVWTQNLDFSYLEATVTLAVVNARLAFVFTGSIAIRGAVWPHSPNYSPNPLVKSADHNNPRLSGRSTFWIRSLRSSQLFLASENPEKKKKEKKVNKKKYKVYTWTRVCFACVPSRSCEN